MEGFWRKCSVCKKEINYNSIYYVCSVSTCNKKRSRTQFCSVSCWDGHRAVMNHLSAAAIEERSPTLSQETLNITQETQGGKRRILVKKDKSSSSVRVDVPQDILVVVSKLKNYINAKSGLNTSQDVMPILSNFLRNHCDKAIDNARQSGRKTVMARDFTQDFEK